MKRRDFLVTSATLAGAAIPGVSFGQAKPCPPPSLGASDGSTVSTACGNSSAAADWAARISAAGVVWHHNFDAEQEVRQFRWTNDSNGKNDPNGVGDGSQYVTHQSTGGVDGGGFMRLTYPAGNASGRGGSYWWRPLNPFTGSGNGRGQDDPAAGGTIARANFTPTNLGTETWNWGNQPNPGWYMHPTHQATYPGKYQGHDFWLQVRVRRAQTPGAPPDSQMYSYITGKNVWLTTTRWSSVNQELVTYGQSQSSRDQVGVQSFFDVYDGQYMTSLVEQQNATVAVNNITNKWRYSGGWDTLLYHITPGTNGGTGTNRERVEVWAAHQGETSYTKIMDVTFTQNYTVETATTPHVLPGRNALILGIYHNGSAFTTTSFNYDYDQVIFSKQFIACPAI